jgi:hypothetical protein
LFQELLLALWRSLPSFRGEAKARGGGGRQVFWHNGSNTMWSAIVAFDPAADRGVVLITNGGIGAARALDAAAMAVWR